MSGLTMATRKGSFASGDDDAKTEAERDKFKKLFARTLEDDTTKFF